VETKPPGAGSSGGLFIAYLALLLWVPIPLGSNRPWAWTILELWVFLLAIGWLFGHLRGRNRGNVAFAKAWPALVCGAVWLGYVWLQLAPLPLALLTRLSPEAARWHELAAGPGRLEAAPLTLDWLGTQQGAIKSIAYLTFFALSLLLLNRRERITAVAFTLVLSGFAQAMFGGLSALASSTGELAHGTFVNRNHYAAYLVMCLSVGIGVLIANLTGAVSRTWKQLFRNVIALVLSSRMLLRLALVVMVIALVLTRSRMGNSSFFVSLLVAGAIGLSFSRRATRSMVVLIASLVVIDLFIVGTYFGVERVVERIQQTRIETEDRSDIASYALNLWRDYPIFGSGLGSFHAVIPRYWGEIPGVPYTHAHNDYLQFACEVGAIGTALLGLILLMSILAALRAQQVRTDPLMRGMSFASLMGIIALMIHSAVEFSLQIPAIALTFMLVLALAWISLYHDRSSGWTERSADP
jgi:putative inorganic carbon (HCO3(-)) transporter